MSKYAVREAKLRQAIADASSLSEQRRLTTHLNALRREASSQVAVDRELDMAATIVRDTMTPVRTHDRHSAASDWLTDIQVPDGGDYGNSMRVQAALWFKRLHTAVKSDKDEFAEQAQGMASRLAGQFGPKAPEARQAFLEEVARLFRLADDRASDQAPDEDQSGNAESQVTDYDTEGGQDPMWGEDWDGEDDTGSQIGSGQPSEQPGATARRAAIEFDENIKRPYCTDCQAFVSDSHTEDSQHLGRRAHRVVGRVVRPKAGSRRTASWSAGWNMPGYMPETQPEAFDSFEDAREYIADELDRAADHVYDTDPLLADAYDQAIKDLKTSNGPEWGDILPTSDSQFDLGISYWINRTARKVANEGKTCATCGDSIAQTDGDWHHDNGEKHDHEAKPGSDKESRRKRAAGQGVHLDSGPTDSRPLCGASNNAETTTDINFVTCDECYELHESGMGRQSRRKTAGVYCKTHQVWVGDGNDDTHGGCSKEQKATEKTKDARRKRASVTKQDIIDVMKRVDGFHRNSSDPFTETDVWWDDPEANDAIAEGVKNGWLYRPSQTQVQWTEAGARMAEDLGRTSQVASEDEAPEVDDDDTDEVNEETNEFAEEVAEELAETSEESESDDDTESEDEVESEDDEKEAKLRRFRARVQANIRG